MAQNETKWLKACGCGCLIVVILVCGLVAGAYFRARAALEKLTDSGWQHFRAGQEMKTDGPVAEGTLYFARTVNILHDCMGDVTLFCQTATVRTPVQGNLYFLGETLFIEAGADISGDVKVNCVRLVVAGKVNGQILGEYQVFEDLRGSGSNQVEGVDPTQ